MKLTVLIYGDYAIFEGYDLDDCIKKAAKDQREGTPVGTSLSDKSLAVWTLVPKYSQNLKIGNRHYELRAKTPAVITTTAVNDLIRG